jgi:hypothetical protein
MTPAQLDALRPKVLADPGCQAFLTGSGDVISLTTYLNQPSGTNGWRSDAPVNSILDAINWANYTPNDAVAGGDTDPLLSVKIGRLLTVQTKQMNMQLMMQGRDTLDCRRPNVRGGLRDAVTQVPTGESGAMTAPGGASGTTVLNQCVRPLNRTELFLAASSQGSDQTGNITARVPTFEGTIQPYEVSDLILNPDGSPRW